MSDKPIVVIGAGLTGLMCSLHLAQRGHKVMVVEQRDHRDIVGPKYQVMGKPGRSMSMDLSARGIYALKRVFVFEEILAGAVPMVSRIIHDTDGAPHVIPYGQGTEESILTVSRTHLYQVLLAKCSSNDRIDIWFGRRLDSIDFDRKTLRLIDVKNNVAAPLEASFVIGTDGINSSTRELAEAHFGVHFTGGFFPMDYKELTIDRDLATGLYLNAMHMWPRPDLMLVAQPNLDGSFTCALMMRGKGPDLSFERINTREMIRKLFDDHFPDISKRMPHLEQEFLNNPIGRLKVIAGSKWGFGDLVLLLGDASHGMVPFFGQGVNCCFEDCTFLDEMLLKAHGDWPAVIRVFNDNRVIEANAINAMSYENYPELFPGADLKKVTLRREVESLLSSRYGKTYRTYHNLVCFERIPYSLAQRVKLIQMDLLEKLCHEVDSLEQLSIDMVEQELHQYQHSYWQLMSGSKER